MYKYFLSLRYLRKLRIVLFGVAAVSLCVALLIIITSLFKGFIFEFKNKERDALGDYKFETHPQFKLNQNQINQFTTLLEDKRSIDFANHIMQYNGLLLTGKGIIKPVQLFGCNLDKLVLQDKFKKGLLLHNDHIASPLTFDDETTSQIKKVLTRQLRREITNDDMPIGIICEIGVVANRDDQTNLYDVATISDMIKHLSMPFQLTTIPGGAGEVGSAETKITTKILWPLDIVDTGVSLPGSARIYVPTSLVAELNGHVVAGKLSTHLDVTIYTKSGTVNENIRNEISSTWLTFAKTKLNIPKDLANKYFRISQPKEDPVILYYAQAFQQQLVTFEIILGFVCLVVSLLIFVILYMIVIQKKRDIGILRSLGATVREITLLYIFIGIFIGALGAALGVALGVFCTIRIDLLERCLSGILGFKVWNPSVYIFSQIPNKVHWPSLYWICCSGIVTSMLGALLPALKASRLQPVDSLRSE